MGGGHVIGVRKDIQAAVGKGVGESLTVTVRRDEAERTVDVPDDMRIALTAAGLIERFSGLSYSHRREHVQAIEGAKRAETRARRIQAVVHQLASSS
jgi:uncharacterized protein YdeI (YjbR/CyaY-like superfamily)